MNSTLPGTVLPLPEVLPERPFSLLEPVFAVSGGGLLLSQVTELTGLSPPPSRTGSSAAGYPPRLTKGTESVRWHVFC